MPNFMIYQQQSSFVTWWYRLTYHESILPIIASVLGFAALILSIYTFKRTLDFQAYRELDSDYADILNEGIKHPSFRDWNKTNDYETKFNHNDRLRYESYANIVWDVCESAYDRRRIDETWLPAFKVERYLHINWFIKNQCKFKQEFRDYIMKNKDGTPPLRYGRFRSLANKIKSVIHIT
jgi:hypothetical protein